MTSKLIFLILLIAVIFELSSAQYGMGGYGMGMGYPGMMGGMGGYPGMGMGGYGMRRMMMGGMGGYGGMGGMGMYPGMMGMMG